jgi:polyisoprenyl-teichoic acid--peptidoglycan teichoic acid transferase
MAPVPERRRRTQRRDRSAQLTVFAFAVVVGLVAAVAGTPRFGNDRAGATAVDGRVRAPASTLPPRTLLFGHLAPGRRLDLLVAFAWDRGANTGSAILIPSTLMVEVPSLGPEALADVPALASTRMLETVVENTLGVAFDGTVLVNDAQLARVLAPAGPMTVDFPDATRIDDDAGVLTFQSGRHRVEPSEAMRLLAGTTHDELAHLVTVAAVLDGWRDALTARTVARATVAVDRRLLPLTIASGATVQDSTLPVERLSSGDEERFRVRTPDAFTLLQRSMPWALIATGQRPRVEVLNGVGAVGLTQAVAAKIVPAGGEVTLTGNVPGFGVKRTQVVYYRDDARRAARRFAAALGVGRVVAAADAIDVVDVTVIVGKDFPTSN